MEFNSTLNSQESDSEKKYEDSKVYPKEHMNGMSNGYNGDHKSSKDKHRDKDRDHKHKSSSKDKERDKDKDRHRDKERSKEHKSSSRDKEKDKERSDKDKERERSDKERSDKDKERSKDKHRSDKDKHHSSSSKEHKSSSSSKDKDHKSSSSSKDKDKERKDKDRSDRDKEKSDKDKHRHSSSSKDKHSSSSSKDKKDKHHSSSSKDKDRKDRDKYKEKSKHEKSSEKNKISDSEVDNVCAKQEVQIKDEYNSSHEEIEIKEEYQSYGNNQEYNGNPNVSAASSCDYNLSAFKSESDVENEENRDSDYKMKTEPESASEDDAPLQNNNGGRHRLATRAPAMKRENESDEEDDVPLFARKKVKKEKKEKKKSKKRPAASEDEYDEKPKKIKKEVKQEVPSDTPSPKKRGKKKDEQEPEVWKWWEEEKKDDGFKWHFLEHKGPVFAPPYEPLPSNIKFFYDGKEMRLSEDAEEVAGFYARMLDHDYTTKDVFNNNFFKDWRKVMTDKEKSKITDLKKCNFKQMHAFFMDQAEKNRNRTKEEKEDLKKKNAATQEEYGFCTIDGHKEKIGNFKIEPPGLFRGRGEHPKMGMLKKRVVPEDVLINCSKDSKIPVPPPGHKWKKVQHDQTVTWLASWTENVQNQVKYVMLNPSSKLKGEKDWQKYETARKLAKSIDKIRKEYREDWKSKEMRIRQRAVALYFIDKLALRAGNEKDEDQADTVGCCSLRVEHIELHEEKDGKEFVVVFDFLGKDSIRYYNEVPVEKRVFKNLQLFMENKSPSDDLFDRLNTGIMNKHLNELMEGLTAKVFRTYNASWTLQQQLDELTNPDDSIAEKILSYNRANRAVAILCNHQRSVPKGHAKSMEKLKEKIDQKREQISDAEVQVKDAHKSAKRGSVKEKVIYEKKKKMLDKLREQLKKLEVQETDRDENKAIALGTSKLNYLDPRISVAWCKKFNVPIEKIYNKTQRDKFRWAIDMAGPEYVF